MWCLCDASVQPMEPPSLTTKMIQSERMWNNILWGRDKKYPFGGCGMEPSVRKRIFINPVKWEESESQDCPNDRNMKPYIFMVYKEWQGIHCSFDLLSKSECKADRSKTIKMGGVKVKMLQMGGRLPRWSKCEEPKKPSGSKREGCKCAWKWEGGNIKVKILKMGGGVLKMGGGVRGQQCCKVDTWVMLGAATQVRNCFLTQSGFPLQNYHGAICSFGIGSCHSSPSQVPCLT